jgi:formylglycine-generating enzyme required for sulfatase activity
VADFYVGKYEATQGQWWTLMGNNPSRFTDWRADCPIEQVFWNDAQDFISRMNQKTGKKFRLPAEAE